MSADNGYIIRKNENFKFVLQEYSASASEFPPIEMGRSFDSLEEAVLAYESIVDDEYTVVEYGLTIKVKNITPPTTPN